MMKYKNIIFLLAMLVLTITACNKEAAENEEIIDPVVGESYDLLLYENDKKGAYDNVLQATVKKSDFQFSTFTDYSYGSGLGTFNKAYVYDMVENTESFMLFDELGEPAFLYKADLANGVKNESIVEFEKQDQNNFYVRIFYYDWQNRLGTLLFETLITKSGSEFISNPTYTIDDLSFGDKNSSKSVDKKKGNRSFPMKIPRLAELLNTSPDNQSSLKNTNDGIGDWISSFNELKNSSISQWLSQTRKAGAILTLTGLGLSETVIAAPVGVWLLAGGSTLVVASTALEIVITDKWSNFLTETQSKIESLSETGTAISGNVVQKFQGYAHDLKDHWVNPNINKTSLEELTRGINEDDLLIGKLDLDDLPNKDGVLQIGISWDTDFTDVDLWVTDPFGEKLYYNNPTTASGGYLDRDDTDGYGPENIYWVDNIPDGDYLIQVHYYSGDTPSNYTVKVTNGLGFSTTYNGTLAMSDDLHDVAIIHKSGINISK